MTIVVIAGGGLYWFLSSITPVDAGKPLPLRLNHPCLTKPIQFPSSSEILWDKLFKSLSLQESASAEFYNTCNFLNRTWECRPFNIHPKNRFYRYDWNTLGEMLIAEQNNFLRQKSFFHYFFTQARTDELMKKDFANFLANIDSGIRAEIFSPNFKTFFANFRTGR